MSAAQERERERKKSITWGGNGNVGVIVQKPHYTSAEGGGIRL